MSIDRKRTKGPKTSPIYDFPRHDFLKHGFGTVQVQSSEWKSRIAATSFTLNVVANRKFPENTLQMHHSLHVVRDMFRRIHVGDSYDWFSTSRLMGYPSSELCKSLWIYLAELRGSVRAGDPLLFNNSIDKFTSQFGDAMLENYLRMTVEHGHLVREEGWAYILWSSSERDILHIGAASGEIEEVLRRLDSENRDKHPHGVLAAWLVHDPALAAEDINAEFQSCALGQGLFRTGLGTAKQTISKLLRETDNFALSPWHHYELHQVPSFAPLAARGLTG
ncbi:hypothetical protein [Rhizobium sp. 2MFCol3.1]|uniref:hypothetical protein n=1 Tax=Rhizobium sp. 2MFCol3.1 TaxID=1246459 RepID=UPI0003659792|nr:hypothetical protein [Rhizobium sp. 2MFCol3.1]